MGDDAFPLRTNLLKPYPRSPLTLQQPVFYYRLSRAGRTAENAFGILVQRFRIYEKPIPVKVETTETIIKAACALHNWLRKTYSHTYIPTGCIYKEDIENSTIISGNWCEHKVNGIPPIGNVGSNYYSPDAATKRNSYAQKFTTTETVTWQWKMI